jgi:hypothetical protein
MTKRVTKYQQARPEDATLLSPYLRQVKADMELCDGKRKGWDSLVKSLALPPRGSAEERQLKRGFADDKIFLRAFREAKPSKPTAAEMTALRTQFILPGWVGDGAGRYKIDGFCTLAEDEAASIHDVDAEELKTKYWLPLMPGEMSTTHLTDASVTLEKLVSIHNNAHEPAGVADPRFYVTWYTKQMLKSDSEKKVEPGQPPLSETPPPTNGASLASAGVAQPAKKTKKKPAKRDAAAAPSASVQWRDIQLQAWKVYDAATVTPDHVSSLLVMGTPRYNALAAALGGAMRPLDGSEKGRLSTFPLDFDLQEKELAALLARALNNPPRAGTTWKTAPLVRLFLYLNHADDLLQQAHYEHMVHHHLTPDTKPIAELNVDFDESNEGERLLARDRVVWRQFPVFMMMLRAESALPKAANELASFALLSRVIGRIADVYLPAAPAQAPSRDARSAGTEGAAGGGAVPPLTCALTGRLLHPGEKVTLLRGIFWLRNVHEDKDFLTPQEVVCVVGSDCDYGIMPIYPAGAKQRLEATLVAAAAQPPLRASAAASRAPALAAAAADETPARGKKRPASGQQQRPRNAKRPKLAPAAALGQPPLPPQVLPAVGLPPQVLPAIAPIRDTTLAVHCTPLFQSFRPLCHPGPKVDTMRALLVLLAGTSTAQHLLTTGLLPHNKPAFFALLDVILAFMRPWEGGDAPPAAGEETMDSAMLSMLEELGVPKEEQQPLRLGSGRRDERELRDASLMQRLYDLFAHKQLPNLVLRPATADAPLARDAAAAAVARSGDAGAVAMLYAGKPPQDLEWVLAAFMCLFEQLLV